MVALLLFVAACGGDDDSDDSDDTGSNGNNASTKDQPTPNADELAEFTKITAPGFKAADGRIIPAGATITFSSEAKTAGGANVLVLARLAGCDPFVCGDLDPKKYETEELQSGLKSQLPPAHIENPDLVWSFGAAELSPSATGLYTYARSYIETKDASGSTTRTSANAYTAWYHDGGSLVTLEVFARGGDSITSLDDVERRMTRAEAEDAAKAVFAAIEAVVFTK